MSLLAFRNIQQKRKLQEQKISEPEKDKLLLTTQSILNGQEAERSRLAKDLHGGLGELLSSVKLQPGAIKKLLLLLIFCNLISVPVEEYPFLPAADPLNHSNRIPGMIKNLSETRKKDFRILENRLICSLINLLFIIAFTAFAEKFENKNKRPGIHWSFIA